MSEEHQLINAADRMQYDREMQLCLAVNKFTLQNLIAQYSRLRQPLDLVVPKIAKLTRQLKALTEMDQLRKKRLSQTVPKNLTGVERLRYLSGGTNATVAFVRDRRLLLSQRLAQYAVAIRSAALESKDLLSVKCVTPVCSRAVAELLNERRELASNFTKEAATVVAFSCPESYLNPSLCLARVRSSFERLIRLRAQPKDFVAMTAEIVSWYNESAAVETVEKSIRAARVAYSECVFSLSCRRLVRRRLDDEIAGFGKISSC